MSRSDSSWFIRERWRTWLDGQWRPTIPADARRSILTQRFAPEIERRIAHSDRIGDDGT